MELRACAAHARSLGPHYSQTLPDHVRSTRRGNSAERARGRSSLLSFLRAQYKTETLPSAEGPPADEHTKHYDPHQRALAGAVAQALSARPPPSGKGGRLYSRPAPATPAGWILEGVTGGSSTLPLQAGYKALTRTRRRHCNSVTVGLVLAIANSIWIRHAE